MSLNHRRIAPVRHGGDYGGRRSTAIGGGACRCESPRDLEMHHLLSLDAGGDALDASQRLACLCAACHVDSHRSIPDPERAAWLALLREENE